MLCCFVLCLYLCLIIRFSDKFEAFGSSLELHFGVVVLVQQLNGKVLINSVPVLQGVSKSTTRPFVKPRRNFFEF